MNKNILVAIIVAAIVFPAGVYAAMPYFTETMIDEPSPVTTFGQNNAAQEDEDAEQSLMRSDVGEVMGNMMMKEFNGGFQGAGDGIHNASGKAKVLYPGDDSAILRFENFRVTNGPDLYVYLSTDKSASDYIDLGRLKANSGNQNYELPDAVDLSKYNTVIIWCKAFNVYFGGAELGST